MGASKGALLRHVLRPSEASASGLRGAYLAANWHTLLRADVDNLGLLVLVKS